MSSSVGKLELPSLTREPELPELPKLPDEPDESRDESPVRQRPQRPQRPQTTPNKTPNIDVPRRRKRAISMHERNNSDSEEACIHAFNLSLDQIMDQNKKMKQQVSWLIDKLDRAECLDLVKTMLKKYPELIEASQHEKAKYSPRFQELIPTPRKSSKRRNSYRKSRKIRMRASSNSSPRTSSPRIPESELTDDQKNRDLVRLRAHLNTLVALLPHSKIEGLGDLILNMYPNLKQDNSKFLVLISPRGYDVRHTH